MEQKQDIKDFIILDEFGTPSPHSLEKARVAEAMNTTTTTTTKH